MKETKFTYCRLCEPNCGLEVTLENGRIVNVAGDMAHPLSSGYICMRGRHSIDVHNDPDRVKFPLKKEKAGWSRLSWAQATGEISAELNRIQGKYGPHAVAVYMGNPTAFDYKLSFMVPGFVRSLGTRNFFTAGTQDCNNKFAASEKVWGSPLIQFIPDVDNMDLLIIAGSNPAVSHMSFISLARPMERLRALEKRGGKIIIIDPRRTETADAAGEHIFIRPDTDIFLFLAMINEIINKNLYDKNAVESRSAGFGELKELVRQFPPEKAAEITGIPAERIRELSKQLATTPRAGLYASLGINLGRFGTLNYWLVQALNFITGHIDREGGMIYVPGLVNMPRLFKYTMKAMRPASSRIGGYPQVMGSLPAGIMADEILTPGEGQVRALIVVAGNPLLTVPNAARLEKALKSLDLVVSLDMYLNETAGLGHYLLPSTDFYEREDFPMTALMFRPELFVQYTKAVAAPDGEQKDSWEALRDLTRVMKLPLMGSRALDRIAAVMDGISRLFCGKIFKEFHPGLMLPPMLAAGQITLGRLKKKPHGVILKKHVPGSFFRKNIMTDDKKVHIAPPEFIKEAGKLGNIFNAERKKKGFLLIGQRQRITHNTWMHNIPAMSSKEGTNRVTINDKDARKLRVKNGDSIKVKSATGSITLPCIVTENIMPGVISIPHGWGHDYESGLSVAKKYPGVNVNLLAPDGPEALEPFAGMARLNGIPVSVSRVNKRKT